MRRTRAWWSVALALLLLAACGDGEGATSELIPPPSATATPSAVATATPEPDGATAVPTATPDADGMFVVACGDPFVPLDKRHRLEADCAPVDLRPVPEAFAWGPQTVVAAALGPLVEMLEDAAAAGHRVVVLSAYRSYEVQQAAFRSHVESLGLEQAERVSARPGHSEHQLGTTVDFASAAVGYALVEAFGDTPEGRWLAERAHEYGFALSYPRGAEAITGYQYEPWHFRWLGREMAEEVRASGLTLTEFLRRR